MFVAHAAGCRAGFGSLQGFAHVSSFAPTIGSSCGSSVPSFGIFWVESATRSRSISVAAKQHNLRSACFERNLSAKRRNKIWIHCSSLKPETEAHRPALRMGHRIATLATCNLDQWAMDFQGNLDRVIASIVEAKRRGARYRVWPELEIPGYGCEDHFNEQDTVEHSWEALAEILRGGHTQGIICDVGMPVMHRSVRYNCRVFLLNGKVLLIRPKMALADDGNYRETRYFSMWKLRRKVEDHGLPAEIRQITGQATCPLGDAALAFNDMVLAGETCEELFTPAAPHIALALSGVGCPRKVVENATPH